MPSRTAKLHACQRNDGSSAHGTIHAARRSAPFGASQAAVIGCATASVCAGPFALWRMARASRLASRIKRNAQVKGLLANCALGSLEPAGDFCGRRFGAGHRFEFLHVLACPGASFDLLFWHGASGFRCLVETNRICLSRCRLLGFLLFNEMLYQGFRCFQGLKS